MKLVKSACIRCGKEIEQPEWRYNHKNRKKTCSKTCCYKRWGNNEQRFWRKVDKRGPDECWPFTGTKNQYGYGRIRKGGDRGGKMIFAHRVSWEMHNGPIPDGLQALHKCDNPPCVNPAHLFLGDNDDNIKDKLQKGRARSRQLNENARVAIMALLKLNVSQAKIGEVVGVCPKTVQRYAKRKDP